MKKLMVSCAMILALAATGCNDTPPGGPGTGARDTGLGLREADNTFRLDLPNLETELKQGETKTVTISISRGKNFDQDVKLEFGGVPKGVKVTPAAPEIKASTDRVQVTIEAAADAALGEHTITVTGTPARAGAKTSGQFQIQVNKAG